MKTIYIVYWFIQDSFKKRMTSKEFDSLKEAESFANEKLTDCVYMIRKVKEVK